MHNMKNFSGCKKTTLVNYDTEKTNFEKMKADDTNFQTYIQTCTPEEDAIDHTTNTNFENMELDKKDDRMMMRMNEKRLANWRHKTTTDDKLTNLIYSNF